VRAACKRRARRALYVADICSDSFLFYCDHVFNEPTDAAVLTDRSELEARTDAGTDDVN
jgi:hypothetical protein